MKKKLALICLLSFLLVLSACSGGSGSTQDGGASTGDNSGGAGDQTVNDGMVDTSQFKKDKDGPWVVGVANISVVNSYRVQMIRELEAAAEEMGVELYYTEANEDVSRQVSDIQDLMSRGVDALIVIPGSASATNAVTRQALDQNIPVIMCNSNVDDTDAYTAFCGSDETEFGYVLGKWLVNELNGEGNIIVLNGSAGNSINQEREDGLKKAIAELPDGGENINILATYYADWAYDKGKQSTEQGLAAYPNIDGVWSQGGAMSQGAIEAFLAAGRPLVPITGEDGNGFLKLWLEHKDDGFRGVAASEPTWVSAVALETAINCLNGEPVSKFNYIPVPTITDADIEQYARPEYSDAFWCNTRLTQEQADAFYLE